MKRYLTLNAAAFLAMLVLVAAFNFWVDPYRIWRWSRGYSQDNPRPRATQHVALLKERGIFEMHPMTLVLGNSRAEIGLDPNSPRWPEHARPVFNAAVPGAGIGTALHMLSLALAKGHVERLVVGLEFLDFLVDPRASAPPERETAPPEGGTSGASRFAADAQMILSLDTFFDAVVTLMKRGDANAADVTRDGFNPLHEYELSAVQEGYGTLFLQRDSENARAYASLPKAIVADASGTSAEWRTLERLVALARENGVEVKFVIYPYHAHILQMFYDSDLMPAFVAWKRRLVRTIHGDGSPSAAQCALWDFSGYHAFARESVPAVGDKQTIVASYWESGHFKRQLGDRMLARMFNDDGSDAGFGACLTAANVEDRIFTLSRDRDRYVAEHPEESAEIARLVGAQARIRPQP